MGRYRTHIAPVVASYVKTPLGRVLGTLVGRWRVLALEALGNGHSHFNELQRCLDGISHKVLIDTLRALQREGLVDGPLTNEQLTEYQLTQLGIELLDLIGGIRTWAEDRSSELSLTPRMSRTPSEA